VLEREFDVPVHSGVADTLIANVASLLPVRGMTMLIGRDRTKRVPSLVEEIKYGDSCVSGLSWKIGVVQRMSRGELK